jgi:hypothetical protein
LKFIVLELKEYLKFVVIRPNKGSNAAFSPLFLETKLFNYLEIEYYMEQTLKHFYHSMYNILKYMAFFKQWRGD